MAARPILKSHPLPRLGVLEDEASGQLLQLLLKTLRKHQLWKFERPSRERKKKEEDSGPPAKRPKTEPEKLVCVGLNSVLRGLESRDLVLAFFDSSLVAKVTAVGTFLASAAARSPTTLATAIPNLSAFAPQLGLKSLAAIGFKDGPQIQDLLLNSRQLIDTPTPPTTAFAPTTITPLPNKKAKKRKK